MKDFIRKVLALTLIVMVTIPSVSSSSQAAFYNPEGMYKAVINGKVCYIEIMYGSGDDIYTLYVYQNKHNYQGHPKSRYYYAELVNISGNKWETDSGTNYLKVTVKKNSIKVKEVGRKKKDFWFKHGKINKTFKCIQHFYS